MKNTWCTVLFFVAITVGLAPLKSLAQKDWAEVKWVQVPWLNVLSAPENSARVLANWPTNTPVHLLKKKAQWCQVSNDVAHTSVIGKLELITGYVDCAMLSDHALTLHDIEKDKRQGSFDGRGRIAFWIAPTIQRFIDAGADFNYHALSTEQQQREQKTHIPVRFVIPEFEAMKRVLLQGVVPKAEKEWLRVSADTYELFNGNPQNWRVNDAVIQHLKTFSLTQNLPPTKPSLFQQQTDILLSGEANVDTIAAMLKQASHVKFGGKPQWVDGHHTEGVSSIWDIRTINVQYAQPVTLYSISHTGLLAARTVKSTNIVANSADDGCIEGYPGLPDGTPMRGYARFKSHPLVSFYVSKSFPQGKTEVLTRMTKIRTYADPYNDHDDSKDRNVLIHSIDLNQDGIPDMAIFEWQALGAVSELPQSARYYFLNIAGKWWFADYESIGECT